MVKYLCIIQARVNSSRLPCKVLLDLAGKTLIERVYDSVLKSNRIDKIIVATSEDKNDDILEYKLKSLSIDYFRGDLNNVLSRYYYTAIKYKAKNIIRVTADNPLTDFNLINKLIDQYENNEVDYCGYDNNTIVGISSEVFSFASLEQAYLNSRNSFDTEHVTPYIKENSKSSFIKTYLELRKPELSVTIDTFDDYIKISKFYTYCIVNNINPQIENYLKYLRL